MQFSAVTLSLFLTASTGVRATMSSDQIIGGLNQFRDLAAALQPTADSLTVYWQPANTAALQTVADGWSQALLSGTQFVQGIDGTPAINNATVSANIFTAYDGCATAHKKLLKTLSDHWLGVAIGSAPGKQLASTMSGIQAVINGLTADLITIVGPGSQSAANLAADQAGLINGAKRVQACYSADVINCNTLGFEGY